MKNILQVVVALPLLLASAAAQSTLCRTTMGTKSIKSVPTSWTTSTIGRRPTEVLVNQRTVTSYKGIITTSTILSTSTATTTDTTPTETATVGSVFFDVLTSRETITNTVPVTTTRTVDSISTTNVPTPAGFRPLGDTINQGPLLRREQQHPHDIVERQSPNKKVGVLAATFPNSVRCIRYVPNTKTFTTTTTLKPQTNTMTYVSKVARSTSVIDVTETVFPAMVTETFTSVSSSTVQTTTTLFETSTTTLEAVATQVLNGPTFYDACKPESNNFVGPNLRASDGQIYRAVNILNNGPNVGNSGTIVSLNGINTREECCAKCQLSPICEAFLYRRGGANCFLMNHPDNTCSAQNQPNMILSKKGADNGVEGYTAGNGKCGYAYSSNSDGSLFSVSPA